MSQVSGWFLENMIDYAGTFPPAQLPGVESYQNYGDYLKGSQKWIVGSLAWSALDLSSLTELAQDGRELEVAVIGRPSTDWDSWQDARAQDAKDMNDFLTKCPNASIATYESRLTDLTKAKQCVMALKGFSNEADVFIELPWDQPFVDALAEIAESEWACAKFRTGGIATPTSDQLAAVIHQCVDLEVEFKLTAGLHEPIAHTDEGIFSHGFLNVMLATSLAFHQDGTRRELSEVLASTDPTEWKYGSALSWQDHLLGKDELDDVRSFFRSFGSCSIDEPTQGLARLARI